jgi:hypothetical protein
MIVNEISLVIQRIIEDGKEKGNTKGNSLDVREIPSQQLLTGRHKTFLLSDGDKFP